jgi:RHS repeat-associated protein
MRNLLNCRLLGFVSLAFGLLVCTVVAHAAPDNRRCLTREQLLIEPLFSACPPLIDKASVSDNSFVATLNIRGGPSRYTMRWRGPSYFNEDVFTYNEETGLYDGFCATYACSIGPGGWVQMEHWNYFVGTLLADDVGSWTYEELHDEVVAQSRTFEVEELKLTAESGADQIGIVDQNLPHPLILRLESFEGIGIEDEVIGWSIDGPKGAKRAAVYGIGSGSETNAQGQDAATVRLGSKPGEYVVRLNNRRVTSDSQPSFTFTAIDDIRDADPLQDHPEVEEGVGELRRQQCDAVGNPIVLSLGNKFQREVDLEPTGISPVAFVRYHNSLGFVSRSFANYWTHSYDRYVEVPTDPRQNPVKVVRPDGRKIRFDWDGAVYRAAPGVHSTLQQTSGGWHFVDEDATGETFDPDGQLIDITDRHGRLQTAFHDTRGKLIRIESSPGGSLDFGYDGSGRLASVTDQAGRTWKYRYEVLGRLGWVDNPDGTTREYHYEDLRHAYALTGITTENGQRYSWYEYDAEGRATASYHAGDADRVDISYQPNGDRIVLDPLGNATLYQTHLENRRGVLDGISGPTCSQGCGETETRYEYDANLNVTSKTTHGVVTRYGDYDALGQPGYMVQASGTPEEKRIEYEYDPAFRNRVTRISEPSVYPGENKVTTRAYDVHGNLLQEMIVGFDPFGQPVERTTTYTHGGPFGQLSAADGPRTDREDVTRYEYYPDSADEGHNRARLKAVVDANGIRIRDGMIYSATGNILAETRPNGITLDYAYYAGNDRIRSVTESGGGLFNRTQWEYTPVGDVQRVIIDDETGAEIITRFAYDGARRLRRVETRLTGGLTASAGQWTTYEFDDAGNPVAETHASRDAPGKDLVIERVFDAYDRLDTITRGGITVDFDYNPDGTLAAKTDGNLNRETYGYDAFRRLTSTHRAGEVSTLMSYDNQGHQLSVSDAEGNTTQYLHDDLGNRIQVDSPDSGTSTWGHNGSGQVVSHRDANGGQSTLSYDAGGRLTAIDRSGTDYDIDYGYDSCENGAGRLCVINTGWGHSIRYGWNALGELSSVTTDEGRLAYSYGPQGTLTSIEYPSGRKVLFEIDGGGLPVQIRLRSDRTTESILVDDIRYSALGRAVAWRFANGLQTTIDLDARQRALAIDVSGLPSWQAGAYDANDNLLEMDDGLDRMTFAYDALDRLVRANSSTSDLGFTYDGAGNRLSTTSGGETWLAGYEDGSNRLAHYAGKQYRRDPNGNTTAVLTNGVSERSYRYSSHNRLAEVLDDLAASSVGTYRYDALGQRVQKTTPAGTSKFLYGPGGELLAVLDASGRILHEYVYLDGQPVVDLHELPDLPPPSAPREILIDNDAATVYGANWQTKSSALAINGTYLQNRKRTDRAVYWYLDQPDFDGGAHDVYVRWLQPAEEGSSTVYDVRVSGQSTHRVVVEHQAHDVGDWVLLGNFDFGPAGTGFAQYVALTGFRNDYGFEGTFLEADAVKLVPTSIPQGYARLMFIHGDHLGTPRFVTDESGQIVWSASYLPFGKATVDEDADGDGTAYSLNLRFPGQYHDAESGFHYNYFRDYDPLTGRYLQSDPIGLRGGLNTFTYAVANPLRFTDPLGLDTEFCQRPFYPTPIPYARHCYVRYTGGGSSSFGPGGPGPDPAPEWWPESCQATQGKQDDECMSRAMNDCQAEQYDFLGFNCCHCVERAMRLCGIHIPAEDWPNWPVNPGPQPGEPGYTPDPWTIGMKP